MIKHSRIIQRSIYLLFALSIKEVSALVDSKSMVDSFQHDPDHLEINEAIKEELTEIIIGDKDRIPKQIQKRAEWNEVGESIDGTSDHGQLGHKISMNYNGKLLAACGSVNAVLYRLDAGEWVKQYDFSEMLDTGRGFYSIALSSNGKRLALGASSNDFSGTDSGFVMVFEEKTDLSWSEVGNGNYLSGDKGDHFGNSLALSENGEILVVGAYGGGYFEVYSHSPQRNVWSLNQRYSGTSDSGFGFSVAISGAGDVVIAGAPWSNENKGYVRLYDLVNFNYILQIEGTNEGDHFGFSVSLSLNGKRVAGGAFGANYVRIYEYEEDTNAWKQVGLELSKRETEDAFGSSISLSETGDLIAVSSPWNGDFGRLSGEVEVYESIDEEWTKLGSSIYGGNLNDSLGKSLFLAPSGKRIAIGCPGCGNKGYNRGSVQVLLLPNVSYLSDDDNAPSSSPAPSLAPSPLPSVSFVPSISNSPTLSFIPSMSMSPTISSRPTTFTPEPTLRNILFGRPQIGKADDEREKILPSWLKLLSLFSGPVAFLSWWFMM